MKLKMYRITLKCRGIHADLGAQAAKDIEQAFSTRINHVDVHCWWDGMALFITSWNDFDDTGQAMQKEFSEALALHVPNAGTVDIETIEVLAMR